MVFFIFKLFFKVIENLFLEIDFGNVILDLWFYFFVYLDFNVIEIMRLL